MARDVFGLPSVADAVLDGCVGQLQTAWAHDAVFLARKATIGRLKSDAFFRGVPRERGGVVRNEFARRQVEQVFVGKYRALCDRVREGEVLVSGANIVPFVALPAGRREPVEVVKGKPVSFAERSQNLAALKARLGAGKS